MNYRHLLCLIALSTGSLFTLNIQAQVEPRDVDAARNIRGQGTSLNTNARFSLSMRQSGSETLINTASVEDNVVITAVITPESSDIGEVADIIIVDANATTGFTMRNLEGNFIPWNGVVPDLVASQEDVQLSAQTEVDVFSGELGTSGSHKMFVGFLVRGDTLYFTPQALKFTIQEAAPDALQQAQALFETNISPEVIQSSSDGCIECHKIGGLADGIAQHLFTLTADPDHLSKNFDIFDQLVKDNGIDFILSQVLDNDPADAHLGGVVLENGSSNYSSLVEFLELLDQIE